MVCWDHGVDVLSHKDRVPYRHARRVQRALGVASRKELKSRTYWETLFGIAPPDLLELLESLGTRAEQDNTRLPRGSVARLKTEAKRRGINPFTGITHAPPIQRDHPTSRDPSERPIKQFEWKHVGHQRPLRLLNEEEVVGIHWSLVDDFADSDDPISPPGVRSKDLLGSAVFRPHTSLQRERKYPTVEMSAAALLHAIIHDHPFHNGNKRTALVSMLVVLDNNGIFPVFDEDELFKFILKSSQHRLVDYTLNNLADREVIAISEWIHSRTRLIDKQEKPIPWRNLKRILLDYDCEFDVSVSVGNRINISRVIVQHGIFGRQRSSTLSTQVFYGGDGRDVEIDTIKKIRTDLHLDDKHGIDSHNFYDKNPMQAGDFIARYRKTLERLSPL